MTTLNVLLWVEHPGLAILAGFGPYSKPGCYRQMGRTGSWTGPWKAIRPTTFVTSFYESYNHKPCSITFPPLFFSHPSTCSCPFFTPSRKPCNSRARLASTNFSRIQASKHQVNCQDIDVQHSAQACRTFANVFAYIWNQYYSCLPTEGMLYTWVWAYLVAGVYWADLTDVQVMEGHEQLCTQGAVVDITSTQEKCSQKLEHHVI